MKERRPERSPGRLSRRGFLGAAAAGVAPLLARAPASAAEDASASATSPGRPASTHAAGPALRTASAGHGFGPRIEVDPDALRHNAAEVARLTGGRPIMAVVKNNAYGLGLGLVAPVLEAVPEVRGFAVVTPEAALALREAGVRKPVLLMGMASDEEARDLVARDVRLSLYTDDAPGRASRLAASGAGPVTAHLYLDTGLGRMGVPYHRALPWLEALAGAPGLRVEGTFMAFTEDPEFDPEQLRRFVELAGAAREAGLPVGRLHAASSNGVFHLPDAHLDLVRPGIALFGSYPSRPEEERAMATLRPAFRLRARVVRVERLRVGDGVSYGRNYVATRPTWTATLPVGHADGYPRSAVEGAKVLIGGRLHPVIGAVSASHTVVELGEERAAEVGDVATLVGPDRPEIHPDALAAAAGVSVYDVLMHMGAHLPRAMV